MNIKKTLMFYAVSLLGIIGLISTCPTNSSFNDANNNDDRTQIKFSEATGPRLLNGLSSGVLTEVSVLQTTSATNSVRFEFKFTAPETDSYYLGYEKNIINETTEEESFLQKQVSLSYKTTDSDDVSECGIYFDYYNHPLIGVGSGLTSEIIGYADLPVEDFSNLDYSSLEIVNIFKAVGDALNDIETNEVTGEWIYYSSEILSENIHNGQIFSMSANIGQVTNTVTSASVEISFEYDSNINNFYIGYGNVSTGEEQKASLEYTVKTVNGSTEKRTTSIIRQNANDYYDLLGGTGSKTVRTYCDISLFQGETLLTTDFSVTNIFGGYFDSSTGRFNVSTKISGELEPLSVVCGKTSKHKSFELNNFVSFSYLGSSSFNGYGTVSFKCENKVTREFYKTLITARLYNDNSDYLDDGTVYIRTRINLKTDTVYSFYYEGQDEPVTYKAPSQYANITNGGNIELLFEGLDINNLTNVTISNYTVIVDMFNNEKVLVINSSNYSARFSTTELGFKEIEYGGTVYVQGNPSSFKFNIDLFMIISFIVLVVIYEGISVGTFFYLKKKNKNDEFKRIRPKQYWKTNTIGLFTCTCILFMLESIIFRSTIWNNTIYVYNSMDILICVFTVASIIMGGYFIRYFAIQIKNIRDVKREEKSKKRNNALDEGTLIIPTTKGE